MKERIISDQATKLSEAFSHEPRTMLEASRLTGIERGSICWWVGDQLEDGKLFFFGFRLCRVSGRRAKVWTSNPRYFSHYVSICAPFLEGLSTDEQTLVSESIIEFCSSGFNPDALTFERPSLRELWESKIVPEILNSVKK